jgi:hypothetical protein
LIEITIWIRTLLQEYLKKHTAYQDPKDTEGVILSEAWHAFGVYLENIKG